MADRVRTGPARKRSGARRPARKRERRLGKVALALLAALILGFLAKRVMIPSAVHYIAYRAPDQPQSAASNAQSNEQLTPEDRSELDSIIKRKSK